MNDRHLAARVRRLTLNQIEKILLGDDEQYKKEIIMKLASSVLPRLNEHTGADGGAIEVKQITGMIIQDANQIPDKDTSTDSGGESVD